MNPKQQFSVQAVALSIFTAAAAEGTAGLSPRSMLLCSGIGAAALSLLSVLSAVIWSSRPDSRFLQVGKLVLLLWLGAELLQTAATAQQVCRQEFSSMAWIGLFPLLLWAGWRISPAGWNAPARVLWWFVLIGGTVCLLGLNGQMHWYRLLSQYPAPGNRWVVPVYAEYFALPLLCQPQRIRRAVFLPFLTAFVQAALTMGMALLFESEYPEREFIRAWNWGVFSRMDALLLLIWLTCAIFRVCFLCAIMRQLWQQKVERSTGKGVAQ